MGDELAILIMRLDGLWHCRTFRRLVREGGLEPPLSYENRILNPLNAIVSIAFFVVVFHFCYIN